jgi:long-chain acyl-CoA synthetase
MSRIQEALAGKRVLLTGVTGFFAKALLAKILADIPDIRRICLLIRPAGSTRDPGANVQGRLRREILDSTAFLPLRQRYRRGFDAWAADRVEPLAGDLSLARFGWDAAAFEKLAGDLDVIINSAASVAFDERLDQAVELNIFGPRRLLDLARAGGGIPLVQVSTAYVCGDRVGWVPEEPPLVGMVPAAGRPGNPGSPPGSPIDLDILFKELSQACQKILAQGGAEAVQRALVKEGLIQARSRGWHDVYTMTKSLAEQLLVRDRGDIPLCILRPSIIESALREPQPGWLDGLRMVDPVIVAYARGQFQDFPANPEACMDLVPVDLVVNATLAATAALLREGGLSVYHTATGDVVPLRVRELAHYIHEYWRDHPLRDKQGRAIRVSPWRLSSRRMFEFRYRTLRVTWLQPLQRLMAAPIPGGICERLQAYVTPRLSAAEQAVYLGDLYAPYTHLACTFETRRFRELQAGLDAGDRARFPCDARAINWQEYVLGIHIPGLKKFVLRLEEVPAAGQAMRDALQEAPASAPLPEGREVRTLRDLWRRAAAIFGPATAMEIKLGERYVRCSFEEVGRLASLVGERLLAQGLGAGDRVALLAENRPEWGIGYLGAVSQGMVIVPLDPKLPEAEVEELLQRTGARALLSTERRVEEMTGPFRERLAAANSEVALLDLAQFGNPFPGCERPARSRGIGATPAPDDLASILFTSGTTVAPKGVMLTHANFLANVRAVAQVLEGSPEDRFLSVLPLHHAFEFTCGFLMPLWFGAAITYLPSPSSAQVLSAMQDRKITVLLGVPRLYQLLAQGIEERIAGAGPLVRNAARLLGRLSAGMGMRARRLAFRSVHRALGGRLRLMISGGAPLDPELFDRFHSMGFVLCEGYGLSETAPVVTVNRPDRPRRGAVGQPLPGVEVRIANPDGDGVGEIVVRGPNLMRGYFGQPALTAAALKDGWLHTGDLGRQEADGSVYITGRLKDVIITPAGKNIHPEEVEGFYRDLPGIRESCVVGMPSPGGAGEEVHLVVVPDEAADIGQAAILEAIDQRSRQAPSHRRVQRVHFVAEDLPKTTTLKVKRGAIRRQLEATASPREGDLALEDKGDLLQAAGRRERAMLALIARLAGVPVSQLSPQAHLERDLGFDSLMRVEILAFLDGQRARPLPEDRVARLTTVGEALALVRREPGRAAVKDPGGEVTWQRLLAQPAGERRAALRLPNAGVFQATMRLARALLQRYCGLRRQGLEHVPPKGRPFLLAANHASHLDSFAVLAALGDRAHEVALVGARDYFFNRAWKRLLLPRALPIIPFDREGDFLEGLRLCREAIGQGLSLLIFPEGTRSPTGELQPFKAGVGVLAVELGLPIIPAAIQGTYQALPKGKALPRRRPIRVAFGPPVLPGSPEAADERSPHERYRDAVDRVRAAIEALRTSGSWTHTEPAGSHAGRGALGG